MLRKERYQKTVELLRLQNSSEHQCDARTEKEEKLKSDIAFINVTLDELSKKLSILEAVHNVLTKDTTSVVKLPPIVDLNHSSVNTDNLIVEDFDVKEEQLKINAKHNIKQNSNLTTTTSKNPADNKRVGKLTNGAKPSSKQAGMGGH